MKLEDEIFQEKFQNDYQKAAINIIYTNNWLNSLYSSFLKANKLSIQQFNILRILRGQYPQPASVKLLKERMLDKMSDASRIVEKLRIKGLVKRTICATDRRNVDIIITDKGLETLQKHDAIDDLFKTHFSNLNATEIKQLNNLLDKLRG